jgi:hypothetical protein
MPGATDDRDADVIGMWETADGHIRQELRGDGRYDEARGDRRSTYTGRYTVTGNHIDGVTELPYNVPNGRPARDGPAVRCRFPILTEVSRDSVRIGNRGPHPPRRSQVRDTPSGGVPAHLIIGDA